MIAESCLLSRSFFFLFKKKKQIKGHFKSSFFSRIVINFDL
jgi:hypothetical protein